VNKRNLIIQAAVAGLFSVVTLSAYASGSAANAIGNSAQIATQAVGNGSIIGSGSITYTVEGVIGAGNYYVYVQLGGGATFVDGAHPVSPVVAGALVVTPAPTSVGTASVGAGTVLANTSIVAFPVTVTGGQLLANSTFTFQPTGIAAGDGDIANAVTVATPGNELQATMSLGSSAAYSATGTVIVQDEATAATAPIVTFISGITDNALSSGLFTTGPGPAPYTGTTEKAVINVISGSGVSLTGNVNVSASPSLLDLGGFYFADVNVTHTTGATTPPFGADAVHGFNIATDYTAATSTVTIAAPAGFFNVASATGATPGSVILSTTANCGTPFGTAAAINSAGSQAAFTAVPAFTTNVPLYVCVQATLPEKTSWLQGTPTVTATMAPTATTTAAVVLPVTNLYTLTSNGGSVYVREYVPSTAAGGYTSFIRVINTGNVPAPISFAFIDDVAGGAPGNSGTTTAAVPAGGAITLDSAQIEGLTGITEPSSSNARPRVLVTAPTTITVQSYLYNAAANVFTEVSGGSNGGNGVGTGVPTPATGQ